jgi:hypothetical protein
MCNVSVTAVHQWINRGYLTRDGSERVKLPFTRIGGRIMVDPAEGVKAEWHTAERSRRAKPPRPRVVLE